jgi:hypothetical protein
MISRRSGEIEDAFMASSNERDPTQILSQAFSLITWRSTSAPARKVRRILSKPEIFHRGRLL